MGVLSGDLVGVLFCQQFQLLHQTGIVPHRFFFGGKFPTGTRCNHNGYKLKNDVLKRKSGRKKSQVDHKTPRKRAIEIISEDCGDSPKQVQRYISLTKLIPEMLQKLDDEIISFCPAVEIAALSEKEQRELLVAMEYAQAIPSLSQAQRIRQLSKEKQLSLEKMEEIMCEVKKGEITRVAFTNEQLHKYFPNSYTPAMMKREILALLKLWKKESWES